MSKDKPWFICFYIKIVLVAQQYNCNIFELEIIALRYFFVCICIYIFSWKKKNYLKKKISGSKSSSKRKSSLQLAAQAAIFSRSDVCCKRPPAQFQIQWQIHAWQPVFPDYLSVAYNWLNSDLIQVYIVTKDQIFKKNLIDTLWIFLLPICPMFQLLLKWRSVNWHPRTQKIEICINFVWSYFLLLR